jgi:8-oxo-dGTP pyrophosphatase MutT (NUDIX family)
VTYRLLWRGGRPDDRMSDVLAGRTPPVATKDAATVMLVRPAADGGTEVFMLRRSRGMAFAPGAHVFPGGSVDSGDRDQAIGWAGPSAAVFGAALGAPGDEARAIVSAAVRETFEEVGVLFASADPAGPVVTPDDAWPADRAALAGHSTTLADVLGRRGLVLRADLLIPWARWITPEAEPRRYDTRFFAAALPAGQLPSVDDLSAPGQGPGSEADAAAWLRPGAAIAAARGGEITLLPPTAVTLHEFAAAGDIRGILSSRRHIEPLQPGIEYTDGQLYITIPPGAEYPL